VEDLKGHHLRYRSAKGVNAECSEELDGIRRGATSTEQHQNGYCSQTVWNGECEAEVNKESDSTWKIVVPQEQGKSRIV